MADDSKKAVNKHEVLERLVICEAGGQEEEELFREVWEAYGAPDDIVADVLIDLKIIPTAADNNYNPGKTCTFARPSILSGYAVYSGPCIML